MADLTQDRKQDIDSGKVEVKFISLMLEHHLLISGFSIRKCPVRTWLSALTKKVIMYNAMT